MEKMLNVVHGTLNKPLWNISIDTIPSARSNRDASHHLELIDTAEKDFVISFSNLNLAAVTCEKPPCLAAKKFIGGEI